MLLSVSKFWDQPPSTFVTSKASRFVDETLQVLDCPYFSIYGYRGLNRRSGAQLNILSDDRNLPARYAYVIYLKRPYLLYAYLIQICVQPRQLGCQHDTARICCCAPCCGAVAAERRCLLSIDMSCLRGAQQQTHRTPLLQPNDGTDRQTDGRPTVT